MAKHTLNTNDFSISLELEIFEEDIMYPSNTAMSVYVASDGFSAVSDMDIDVKQFVLFSTNLKTIYDNLSGSAIIQEPYGYHKYISFSSSKNGHILVKGYLCDILKENEIFFSNSFDQTFLKEFANELYYSYSKYSL